MKIVNDSSPKLDPCGTPDVATYMSDLKPLKATNCCLFLSMKQKEEPAGYYIRIYLIYLVKRNDQFGQMRLKSPCKLHQLVPDSQVKLR